MFDTLIVNPLLNLLMAIFGILPGHDFGIAVIIMTLIIRFAMWPLTAKQLRSQKKMQALQPEIVKLKQQAAGDKAKENQLLMELYKEKEINPFSSCLPLLLQFPFLIALFFVLKKAALPFDQISSLLYEPVKNIPYIEQLISGAVKYDPMLLRVIPMDTASKVLAVIAGITQYIQVKMITPKHVDPNDQQAKMTSTMNYIFPAMTAFIAWTLPAALPLYWITGNGVAIFQQWLIMREETEKMEEAVIVEESPKKTLPKARKNQTKKPTTKKKRKK
jgi:YidC/Oxa1 family membrane protein insertase